MRSRFFEEARRCSQKSDYTGAMSTKVGAVAVFKGTVIAKGYNKNKTHPLQEKYNSYRYDTNSNHYYPSKIHAEMEVVSKIRNLDIDFSRIVIYVYRETKTGKLAIARPCKACTAALKDLGIKTVCYTTENGYCEERYKN